MITASHFSILWALLAMALIAGETGPLFGRIDNQEPRTAGMTSESETTTEMSAALQPQPSADQTSPRSDAKPRLTFYRVEKVGAPSPTRSEAKSSAYQLVGYGSSSRIVDTNGNLVLASGPQTGVYIYEALTSPDGKRVLVHAANLVDFILDPTTKRRAHLPNTAPGHNMGVLESWSWLNDTILIAKASEWKEGTDKTKSGFEDESNVVRTRIYVYDLEKARLSAAVLPKNLRQRVLMLDAVSPSGSIHLLDSRAGSYGEKDLGWFAVKPR